MPVPLPPIEVLRTMRFSSEFWLELAKVTEELADANILNSLTEIDDPTADLFFTTLAIRLIEVAGANNMPTLDDTVTMIKVILREEITEVMAFETLNRVMERFKQ